MHAEAYAFVQQVIQQVDLHGALVIEFGAADVNGSVRPLFAAARAYIGVDARPGPGVDVVCRAQDYAPHLAADIVVSTEMLEHDTDPAGTIAAAWRCLRPGGLLILTCACPPRAPHGADGLPGVPPGEHYANISRHAMMTWLREWTAVTVVTSEQRGDLYATARKPRVRDEA